MHASRLRSRYEVAAIHLGPGDMAWGAIANGLGAGHAGLAVFLLKQDPQAPGYQGQESLSVLSHTAASIG